MTALSPVTATLRRRQLHKRSGFALATALKEGARRLPPGALRTFIAKKATRIELCAASQRHRLLNRRDQATVIVSSNDRRCLDRACMNCESLRAKALAAETLELIDIIWRSLSPGAIPLMLTLTSPNRPVVQTGLMLKQHQKALKTFFGYHRIKSGILGQFGNIETDFERRDGALFAHVHSHHILMAEAGALSDHRYIRQAEYAALWSRAMGAAYTCIVDIRRIRGYDGPTTDPASIRGAVREVSKYCLDSGSFIEFRNGNPVIDPVAAVAFAAAVHRRRLTSMTGVFLTAKALRRKERKAR